ncbi:MAG: MBL fold metallo-hydrolase [Gammaproteobacteria bacterium]|jgi:glyoxylase-like metal-dependent hydrolase (beta-lactamase superfamily II)|nr:MBL fold metallo-hydrolase [Gammaproteobacteria bacterium]
MAPLSHLLIAIVLALVAVSATAELKAHRVADDVYAIVGDLGNRSPENLGNNATFGVVITREGVVLIDPGGTYTGAQRLHEKIRSLTDRPVVRVVNTGGQDHRWLGNGYFQEQGASIVASQRAVEDQQARSQDQFFALNALVGAEGLQGTEPVVADTRFDETLAFELGGIRFEIHHVATAHTPGDAFVWLPGKRIVFTGDIVYTERMLGVIEVSNSRDWLEAFSAVAELNPEHVVPGHGAPTTLKRAREDTEDYLKFLRTAVGEHMDAGKDITTVGSIDQSAYARLLNFEQLAGRNAQKVFTELEWE